MEEDEMSTVHVSVEELEEDKGERNTSNPKRLKLLGVDRISTLPDTIILRILSFLPTEDAVRTGSLSTRWKYLWIYVPNLAFSYEGSRDDLDEFYEFISKTLALHFSQKINKWSFSLSLDHSDPLDLIEFETMESIVSLGLRFATIHKMEELSLELLFNCNNLAYLMPKFIYGHSSLTKLFTRSCNFPLFSGQVSWGLLKELIIWETKFEGGVFQMILSGCPLLEKLELKRCVDVPNFDTASNVKLKRLVLDETLGCAPKGDLEISIPTVTSLKILGFCYLTEFKLLNVSSLLDVTLDFILDHQVLSVPNHQGLSLPTCCDYVWQLLERLDHVKKLTVGTWCIQVLSVAMAISLRPPLSKRNCSCLTLATCFEKCDAPGVASLLHSSPYLEKLVVDSDIRRSSSLKLDNVDYRVATDYWTSQTGSFHCLQSLLKNIEIVGLEPESYFEGYLIYDNDQLLEFIKFLLRSAKVLEKLVILAPPDTQWKMEDYYSISQQLLSFPRSSAQAVVL